jgi:hypothetical protein
MFEIDLEWPLASQYVVAPAAVSVGGVAIYVAENATITLRRPLDLNPSLYLEFADLDGSEQACLKFARKYGTLSADPRYPANDPSYAESLTAWKAYIERLKDIIRRCELSRDNPREAFQKFGKEDKWVSGVDLYLSIKSPNSPATIDVRATSLLNGMELQAVQSILQGRRSHQCIECSRWFETGIGGRRSQSKFCSMRCKDSYHNRLKALRAQARRK